MRDQPDPAHRVRGDVFRADSCCGDYRGGNNSGRNDDRGGNSSGRNDDCGRNNVSRNNGINGGKGGRDGHGEQCRHMDLR